MAELERLYHELARIGATAVGRKRPWPYRPRTREELAVLAAEMLRYDPRLLSILLQLVLSGWRECNPLELRRLLAGMRWPQALLVVLEFAKAASSDSELRYFCDYVAAGWPRLDPSERFFLDAERPGSRMAGRNLGRNLGAYARWGFVGHERPTVDPATKRTVGRYDARTRREILLDLAGRTNGFTLADYLGAVDHAVSRQQALKDLKSCPELAGSGHGRGAKWHRQGAGSGDRDTPGRLHTAAHRLRSRAQ
jgi:hypothetical protein